MALTPNFSLAQIFGSPSKITLTDTSTGSDGTITQRRVFIQTATGTYLVQAGNTNTYETWAYANSSVTLNLLDKDYAVSVLVQWLNVSNVVLYSLTQNFGLPAYNEDFDYTLTQYLTANPQLINDKGFWENKYRLRAAIDSAGLAVSFASDLYGAQICYDKGTTIRVNAPYIF